MNTTNAFPDPVENRMAVYLEPSYLSRLAQMARGLSRPRFTREYKAAVIEAQRLSAPVSALLLPLLAVLLLALLSENRPAPEPIYTVHYLKDEAPPPDLKDITPLKPEDATPTLNIIPSLVNAPDINIRTDVPTAAESLSLAPQASLGTVQNIKGFVITCPYGGDRSGGMRGALLASHGGDQLTEDAVLRALRWLKKSQQADGSWKSQKIAMTGLALLTFLAHGETPDTARSPEFGGTVQRALEFLLSSQKPDGHFSGADGNEYAHPIAAYALCEAYGMTLNPNVKAAAEKALVPIIRGQHPTGGWTYRMEPGLNPETGTYRDDTSYMGWCFQALKAARLTGFKAEGLDKALKLAARGFKRNAHPNGGFGYTGPGQGGLTSVGALCLQMLGASQDKDVRKAVELMDRWEPSLSDKSPAGNSPQYYCYYATQSRFHSGGQRWENWNRAMKALYVRSQVVEKAALKDDQGKLVDIGWWTNGDAHTDRPVMDTCLAALQLMVYYRSQSLATTSDAAVRAEPEIKASATESGDIHVEAPVYL